MSIPTFIKLSQATINIDQIGVVYSNHDKKYANIVTSIQWPGPLDSGGGPIQIGTQNEVEYENLRQFLEMNNEPDWPIVKDFTKEQS